MKKISTLMKCKYFNQKIHTKKMFNCLVKREKKEISFSRSKIGPHALHLYVRSANDLPFLFFFFSSFLFFCFHFEFGPNRLKAAMHQQMTLKSTEFVFIRSKFLKILINKYYLNIFIYQHILCKSFQLQIKQLITFHFQIYDLIFTIQCNHLGNPTLYTIQISLFFL